jgi:hypothetical protein
MKKIIYLLLLLICTSAYSQKQLSQGAINELAGKASAFLGVEQNPKVRAAVNRYIATYSRSGPSAAMAGLRNELQNRQDVLILMDRATRDRESLVMTLKAINVNPRYVPEIADYFFPPQLVAQKSATKETSPAKEPPIKQSTEPIVWEPPSKKFFDGRKSFCDSSGKWYFSVVIIKNNILLLKYPGNPKIKDPTVTSIEKFQGVISGENIVTEYNQPSNYKYENNIFYERSDESDRWHKYVECLEK